MVKCKFLIEKKQDKWKMQHVWMQWYVTYEMHKMLVQNTIQIAIVETVQPCLSELTFQ